MRQKLPVNPHRFQFILKPTKVCGQNEDIFLLSYIHTAPDHHKQRMAIRQSWGNPRNFDNEIAFRIVFLMGKPTDKTVQEAVQLESDMYGDIVQENFIDSYRNLTYKAIMGLRWISNYCPQAKYILKTDDDIFVNIFNVVAHLRSVTDHEGYQRNMIQCLVWSRMKVVREPRSKWYIPKSEFADEFFPTYCSGSAYMFSGDVIPKMYNASFDTPFFWVDDFYITGLLASKVNATYVRFNSVYSLAPSTFLEKFTEENKWRTLTFGHVHNLNWWFDVWNKVLVERRPAMLTKAI
jgi:beta-1,3-galactosyltransferase 1